MITIVIFPSEVCNNDSYVIRGWDYGDAMQWLVEDFGRRWKLAYNLAKCLPTEERQLSP